MKPASVKRVPVEDRSATETRTGFGNVWTAMAMAAPDLLKALEAVAAEAAKVFK